MPVKKYIINRKIRMRECEEKKDGRFKIDRSVYSESDLRNEMAECADWEPALFAGPGYGLTAGRQRPILCVRCGQNHGTAVLLDFRDLLYSKLLPAGAQ